MKVITFASEKGGVGKTTLTALIGGGLAMKGHRVLLLDADGQGDLTASMHLQRDGKFYDFCKRDTDFKELVQRVPRDNCPGHLYVVPGNNETWGIPSSTHLRDLVQRIVNRLAVLSQIFQYVLIDTQPSATMLHDAIALITDYVIIPTDLEPFSALGGLRSTYEHMNHSRAQSLQNGRDKARIMAIIPNKCRVTTSLHEHMYETLVETYGELVWEPLPLRTSIPESQLKQTTLMHDAPGLDTNNYLWTLVKRVEQATMEAARE